MLMFLFRFIVSVCLWCAPDNGRMMHYRHMVPGRESRKPTTGFFVTFGDRWTRYVNTWALSQVGPNCLVCPDPRSLSGVSARFLIAGSVPKTVNLSL